MSVKSVEAANSAGFIWMFPLTFVSSAFVATDTMPQLAADRSPTRTRSPSVTNVARALYNGVDPGSSLWIAIAWAVGITVVFATLASRKYSHSTSR